MKKILAMTAAALLATTTMVSAATLSFMTTTPFGQLGVTGPSRVTITLLSYASGVSQSLLSTGNQFDSASTVFDSFFYDVTQGSGDTEAVDFAYSSSYRNGQNNNLRSVSLQNLIPFKNGPVTVSYSGITTTAWGESITAFFDNGNVATTGDEMSIRIDVRAIPVPAAGLLLLSGLGGLTLLRRRNKA